MTRIASLVLAAVTVLGLGACDKPTPEDCRKALLNMQHLLNTESLNDAANLEGEVRRCRGGSKRTAVACAIKATTLDELRACDFEKVPGKAPVGSSGSAAHAAGSAAHASGSAASAPGSAASAPGSAASAPGSAAGSAH